MWDEELEELARRIRIAHGLGGEDNVARQHAAGKMTVRERIEAFCDPGTFQERGVLAGVPTYDPDNPHQLESLVPCPFVMGIGRVDGRRVAVHGDDFTIKGASVGRMYKAKGAYFVKMARSLKMPMVRLVEGAGGSLKEILEIGYTELPSSGDECVQDRVEIMSEVPGAAAAFGSVAGLGALYMVQSHFSVMVRDTSHVFVGGPYLVKSASGEEIGKDELGGYKLHTRHTGVVDNEAADESDALEQIKRFLSYMPDNVWRMPPRLDRPGDDPGRREEELATIIPRDKRQPYDMRRILRLVLDAGSIFEIGKYQGRSQITALARLNGWPVGGAGQ